MNYLYLHSTRVVYSLVLSCLLALAGAASATPLYTVNAIGTLGGSYSNVNGMNNNGQVVGQFFCDQELLLPAFLNSYIGTPVGSFIYAEGSRNAQVFVGESHTKWHAFLSSNGMIRDLGTLGGSTSYAQDISSNGWVIDNVQSGVNISSFGDATMRALRYDQNNGMPVDLGTLGGSYSYAQGINRSGQVVGSSTTPFDRHIHAFLYSNGRMSNLGTLGGSYSYARGINNNGQVVGSSLTVGNQQWHAFLYSNGSMSDLNSLIDPTSGWRISEATSITDSGDILAYGCSHYYCQDLLLDSIDLPSSTVPEPNTLALTSLALLSSVGVRRRVKNRAVGVVQTQVTL